MAVPYTFATASTSIPLSQLDTNFATAITLGATPVVLGNTYSTLSSLTLTSSAFNGTVGATTPSTGVFTSVTDSGLTAGRVNYNGTTIVNPRNWVSKLIRPVYIVS